jgi:multiple sugar transport system ATP-binding protein
MSVRDNMGFALKLAKTPQEEIDRKVGEAAKILDLEPHLDRKPANLSGGQRQRVAMGRAIVRNPKVFLMDEPLSNLDAKLRVQMRTEISRIQQQFETTTIYVTHDQTEAMTLGDRIAVMRAGVLQQVGSPADLYGDPVNLFVAGFIGSPSMNFLAGEIDGDSLKLPIGTVKLPDEVRRGLESGQGGGRRGVIAGLRPEDFEDATLVGEGAGGHTFQTKIDVLESMGSEFYAYFVVESERVASSELQELAEDAGAADLPRSEGSQVVARLDAASRVRQGGEAELWFDMRHIHLFDAEQGHSLLGGAHGRAGAPASEAGSATAPASASTETPAEGTAEDAGPAQTTQ